MEFSKDLLTRSLEIWGFDTGKINTDKIQHVPMHEWRISTLDKPLLYIENLQCCIGLYIYGNNFAFAAHVNTVVFDKNEYIVDEDRIPTYCNRFDDLINEILKYSGEIKEPFKMGIALGSTPLNRNEKSMLLIYEGMDNTIKRLNLLNIPVVRVEDIYNPEFIIDSFNNNIILPDNFNNQKTK